MLNMRIYGKYTQMIKEPLTKEQFEAKIKKALAITGAYTYEDILEFVHAGKMHFIFNDRGCWIVEILSTKRKKVLNCVITAGELDAVLELQPQVLKFAKDNSCQEVTGMCRLGYRKALKELGWKTKMVFVTHDIEEN